MTHVPNELRYSKSHEWVKEEQDNIVVVGITDHAQSQLGDLVFVELPEAKAGVSVGDEVVVVESVKTAADVYSPVSGEVIAVNTALAQEPQKVNQDPYGEGWLMRIKVKDKQELDNLLNAQTYTSQINE